MRDVINNLKKITVSRRRRENGIQLVEVILVLPVLLMLLAATAEFGRYFYTYTVLSRATGVAARFMVNKSLSEAATAKNLVVCGSPICTSAILPGLTANNVSVTLTGTATILKNTVTVSVVNYNYTSVFNLGSWVGGSWTNVPVRPSTTMYYQLEN